jgi:hypothetical protein
MDNNKIFQTSWVRSGNIVHFPKGFTCTIQELKSLVEVILEQKVNKKSYQVGIGLMIPMKELRKQGIKIKPQKVTATMKKKSKKNQK